ncbi:cerato-ulmin [Roridomyces roridus]|uniref:Cerato-ulmin n=1 Tax=Roridomyces roridus TaxID=1738132 RepID=A0AAD7BDQ3_9AGAR|nr:cerato-ulmin [Roridomyces roridus]
MRFTSTFLLTLASLLTVAVAMPGLGAGGGADYTPCTDMLFSDAECCSTDNSGLALVDSDCTPPDGTLTCADDFTNACSAAGKTARCCIVGVGLNMCENPPADTAVAA